MVTGVVTSHLNTMPNPDLLHQRFVDSRFLMRMLSAQQTLMTLLALVLGIRLATNFRIIPKYGVGIGMKI